jgi:hypothetical protein
MSYTFIRWVREGAATAITQEEGQPNAARRPRLDVAVQIRAGDTPIDFAAPPIEMLGMGEIQAIDSRQVIQMVPERNTPDFEPGYFAHVEFDRPDLPWLFTPFRERSAADDPVTGRTTPTHRRQATLTPWICLVVVPKREGISLTTGPALPILRIDDARAELPPLEEAHAWAHVQLAGELPAARRAHVVLRMRGADVRGRAAEGARPTGHHGRNGARVDRGHAGDRASGLPSLGIRHRTGR